MLRLLRSSTIMIFGWTAVSFANPVSMNSSSWSKKLPLQIAAPMSLSSVYFSIREGTHHLQVIDIYLLAPNEDPHRPCQSIPLDAGMYLNVPAQVGNYSVGKNGDGAFMEFIFPQRDTNMAMGIDSTSFGHEGTFTGSIRIDSILPNTLSGSLSGSGNNTLWINPSRISYSANADGDFVAEKCP